MALFKCKMCGGDLEIAEGATIAECEYCGTKQTVPQAMDENLQNLFNRANTLRIKSEFDKAEKLYEKIIEADDTQSEAYWGLILCKYGIEYVDDPKTFKKIPTCHRASYDSIIADDDYKSAIEYADMSQRAIYEEQAKEIDRIQKDILALAQKEETYDVFICYKETDANGHRTQDSVIANDIYYQLTQEGFKVFYAAITLEGKLGSAYEPIIFAALNSAKVMLAIGTKPEYFNAVWVKNEWSRFLTIIKKDRSKLLIPCYRDMDAYELPEEFAHLQAQDMGKIGFINDVVRGIKKVIVKDEPKATVVKETIVTTSSNPSVEPLIKRVFMFLEEENWESADEYCEKILDLDPENAYAYLGKLMVKYKARKKEDLKNKELFDDNINYLKAMRFADDALRAELTVYVDHIKQIVYEEGLEYMNAEDASPDDYIATAERFEGLRGFKDADALAKQCRKYAETEKTYCLATEKIEGGRLEEAIQLLSTIRGWKDADEKLVLCQQNIEKLKVQAEADRIESERLAKIRAKRNKKIAKAIAITASITCAIALLVIFLIVPLVAKANGNYKVCVNIWGLEEFEIPDGAKVINESAFAGCTNLKSVTIPDSVTSIGNHAFNGCSSPTSITIPDGVTSIGEGTFFNCSSLTNITIPDSVTSIGEWAFSSCSSLTSITIPDSVTSIGDSAFYDCSSLTRITIPNSVTSIGSFAFYGCSGLTSITIPNSLTSIGSSAFSGCTSIESASMPTDAIYAVPRNNLKTVVITGGTSIGDSAFYGCSSLTSITIPNGVTSIDEMAFYGCTSLERVYYTGTAEEWNAIDIHYLGNNLSNAPRYYYSETQPVTTGNYWHYVDGVPTVW